MSSVNEWSAVEDGNTHLDQFDLQQRINPHSPLNRYTKKLMAAVRAKTDAMQAEIDTLAPMDAVVHIDGDETIGGTKTFSQTVQGSVSGNAGTATKLATARTINGVAFDGTANITIADGTTPFASDNSTKLATTAWVRDATGDFACNAATASAFASSKAVTLTGAVTGTASSTGGWDVPTVWRSCIVGRSDSGTANPWYKAAAVNIGSASSTCNVTFYVENSNSTNKYFGILRASITTNSSKVISSSSTKFAWLANEGFAVEDFVLVCPATAAPTVELWTKLAVGYLRRRFIVISEGTAGATSMVWTLFDAFSAGQESSIPTEGTQVVSSPSSLEQRVAALEEAMSGN